MAEIGLHRISARLCHLFWAATRGGGEGGQNTSRESLTAPGWYLWSGRVLRGGRVNLTEVSQQTIVLHRIIHFTCQWV